MSDTQDYSNMTKLSELACISDKNSNKNDLLAQALSAVMQSLPREFTPNSLHCLFLQLPKDAPTTWKVWETSSGNAFCHRNVKGYQNDELCLSMNVSVTNRNSHKALENKYDLYLETIQKRRQTSGNEDLRHMNGTEINNNDQVNSESDDDDDEDEKVVNKPFFFETLFQPLEKHKDLFSTTKKSWQVRSLGNNEKSIEYVDLGPSICEQNLPPKVKGNFLIRLGDKMTTQNNSEKLQFVPLATMLDPFYLFFLANHICRDIAGFKFSVSGSHSVSHAMYFHDTDFDCTHWSGLSISVSRLVDFTFILEADLFNDQGRHIATIILEGLLGRNMETNTKL